MPTVNLIGKIKRINDTKVVGANDFKTRSFWLEEQKDTMPNTWALDLSGDKCLLIDAFTIGDTIDCRVDISGKSYVKDDIEKVFNSLKCFVITKVVIEEKKEVKKKEPPIPPMENPNLPPIRVLNITNEELDAQLPFD